MTAPAQTALCLDCFETAHAENARRCVACGSARLRRHAQMFTLSVAHLDCDAFYASVEKRDRPELADKPVIVGGGVRGVVSAACYVARSFGVRSAMPMFKAKAACPDAVVIPPDIAKYARVSRNVRALMQELTPLVQPLSLDEAYLDLTGTERLHKSPPALMLARLARKIEQAEGITVSIGLSANKFLAKFASELDKPRGFAVIAAEEAPALLAPYPPGAIHGVGKAFAAELAAGGITRIAHIQAQSRDDMLKRFGTHGAQVWRLAFGQDARAVDPEGDTKSISAETTFNEDVSDAAALRRMLWRLCEKVASRAKAVGLGGRVVTLKLKTAGFKIITRRVTLDGPTQLAQRIFDAAAPLLQETAQGAAYRLIGTGLSGLTQAGDADRFGLFEGAAQKSAKAERAMDQLRAKFGRDAIKKGRSL